MGTKSNTPSTSKTKAQGRKNGGGKSIGPEGNEKGNGCRNRGGFEARPNKENVALRKHKRFEGKGI